MKINASTQKPKSKFKKGINKREFRRLKRINQRTENIKCFKCRQLGHLMSECETAINESKSSRMIEDDCHDICYKCGSLEHKSSNCNQKVIGYPYAKCFICNQIGHISKNCEQNTNGIYPDGGFCLYCEQKDHLKKDCLQIKNKLDSGPQTVSGTNTRVKKIKKVVKL